MHFIKTPIQFTPLNQSPYDNLFHLQNYQDQDQIPIDIQPDFNQNRNQLNNQGKKHTTTAFITTKITKTIKGRPRKKQNVLKQQTDQILSEHVKTIFGLSLIYASKCLQKQCRKYSKYGFLHKNIAPNNCFYLQINQAIKKNRIITVCYKSILQKQIQQNINLYNFLQKILWIGSNTIIDEILYIITHFINKHHQIMIKYQNLQIAQTSQIQQIKQVAKNFALAQINMFWQKLMYINFKCSKLKLSEETMSLVNQNLLEFIEVLIVSLILSSYNFNENPYFSIYYSYDQQKKIKHKKKPQKKKRRIIQESSEEQQNDKNEQNNHDQQNQNEYNQQLLLKAEQMQIQKYQQMQNSIEYLQYNNNIQNNYLMAFNYGYYNPYNRNYN